MRYDSSFTSKWQCNSLDLIATDKTPTRRRQDADKTPTDCRLQENIDTPDALSSNNNLGRT